MNDVSISLAVAFSSVVGALLGYIGAIFTFRARFDTINAQFRALETKVESDRRNDKEMLDIRVKYLTETLDKIERQSGATLQLVAHIAHKTGVDQRTLGVDWLANALANKGDE